MVCGILNFQLDDGLVWALPTRTNLPNVVGVCLPLLKVSALGQVRLTVDCGGADINPRYLPKLRFT